MESYGTWDNLQQAFVDFANKVPFYGAVVACIDDEAVRAIVPRITRRVISYGLGNGNDGAQISARDVALEAFSSRAVLWRHSGAERPTMLGPLRLQVPGRHNMQNALAAVAVAIELGIPFERIAAALAGFKGAERRFQLRGEAHGVMVVDDYGHHPTEIAAVVAAARAGLDRRVVLVFQPHRYSRTHQLMDRFATVLAAADEIVLTDIYPAGESPIPGITVDALASVVSRSAPGRVRVVRELSDLPSAVAGLARSGDLVVTLGAGSIGTMGERILEAVRERHGEPAAEGKR
jgi:UDP-N-acetylmuramate--alanine ligase